MRFFLMALAAFLAFSRTHADAATIAYDNATGVSGLQDYGNNLGLDFTVNEPITVTALGAFDNGSTANLNGVNGNSGIDVGIFNIATQALVGSPVHFSSTNTGTPVNGDAFLPTSITLQDGTYSIVAFNDGNSNSNGVTNGTSIENTDGGLISFLGGGRFSGVASALGFPGNVDGGPTNRYDAGTFQFVQAPEPTTLSLLSIGIVGLALSARRRWKRSYARP